MESKKYLKSQTIWGAILASVPMIVVVLGAFGIQITQNETSQILNNIDQIISGVIGILGIINVVVGRSKAKVGLKGII